MKLLLRLTAVLVLGIAPLALAAKQAESILLRNVQLIDPATDAVVQVNILIKGYTLDLISQDLIAISEADITYDARNGVVLGKLNLGEPASFMIMDGNPQEDIDILLDTRPHNIFAIRRGEVLRNRLETITRETPEERERSAGGWLAYAPPPLANISNTIRSGEVFTGAVQVASISPPEATAQEPTLLNCTVRVSGNFTYTQEAA